MNHPILQNRVLENLIVIQLVKKSCISYRTLFTRAHHWSLSWSRWIQFTLFSPISV